MANVVARARNGRFSRPPLAPVVRRVIECLEARLQLAAAPRLMEYLDRGVVATRSSPSQVFVSWRSLAFDAAGMGFNVYRQAGSGMPVKLNGTPLTAGTNYTDTSATLSANNTYFVRSVVGGVEQATDGTYTLPANSATGPLVQIPLRNIGNYSVTHMSVADLDGDGKYDYVVDRLPTSTNEVAVAPQIIEAYKSDGTFLWSIDCGPNSLDVDNIEPGSSTIDTGNWDGVTAYDLDGDGFAEVLYRSANGVVFGDGKTLSYPRSNNVQFISVIDGRTGAEKARVQVPTDFLIDGPMAASLAVGYLDGQRPSLVAKMKNRVGDDYFNQMFVAYDYDGAAITQKWKYVTAPVDSDNGHNIRIVDVDGDGKDELADTAQVINGDGTLKYNMRNGTPSIGHGDRFFIGDLDPDRPGLEGYGVQQNNANFMTEYYYDAATGEVLHSHYGTGINDNGRGSLGDIDPNYRGYEYWSFYGLYNSRTPTGGQPPVETTINNDAARPYPYPNFRVWWDGDVLSENLNDTTIDKWNPTTKTTGRVTTLYNYGSPTAAARSAPIFYGDITGDWREEVIFEKSDHTAIDIYTTQIASSTRLYALTQNPEYRNSITAKGYLQSNMLDYYLGSGMTTPPMPNITVLPSGQSAPKIVTKAAAAPSPVTGTTVNLAVLGADDGGEATLTYTWAAAGNGSVAFSANGTNAAKSTVATFSAAGTYVFTVIVRDATGRTAMSNVKVIVAPTLTAVSVVPTTAAIGTDSDQQFVASGLDQFGAPLATQPTFAWNVQSGGGAIDANGNFTPPASAGSATVRATAGTVSGTAVVAFSGATLAAPTNVTATAVSAGQINLTWADTVSGEAGFVVEISTNGVAFTPLATTRANAAGHNVTGLKANTAYAFRVRTLSANGTGVPSNPASATTQQPQAGYFPLNAASGTVIPEASGNSIDGTTRNGPAWVAGRFGNALSFDGLNDYAELPNDTATTAAGGVSLWFKTGQNFSNYAILYYMSSDTYGNGLGSQSELHVNFTSAEKIQLYIRGSAAGDYSNDVNLTSASSYANNAWHHVAATWTAGGNATLFVDGVVVGTQAFTPVFTFTNSQRTYLGRTNLNMNLYTGLIDDVRLFDNALTGQHVQALAGGNQAPTVAVAATAGAVTNLSSTLGVLGADDLAEAGLTYTWSVLGVPPAPVAFSASGTNAAKNSTATFTKSGVYDLQVVITDAGGLSTASTVRVNVVALPAWLSPAADAAFTLLGSTLTVTAGTVTLTGDPAATISGLVLNASGTSRIVFQTSQHLGTLNLADSATATLAAGGGKVLRVTQLNLGTGATLDLNDNDLIYDYGVAGQAAAIGQWIATARNGGGWTGAGLTSGTARTNAATALGYLEASDYKAIYGDAATFAGEPIDSTAVLVRYTLYGDSDLDRGVSINDFNRLSGRFGSTGQSWLDGDYDYDTGVSINDFNLLAANFGKTLPTPQARVGGVRGGTRMR